MANRQKRSSAIPDVLTYQYAERLVFVKTTLNYEEAVIDAQREFASELQYVQPERIKFSIATSTNDRKQTVAISKSAWSSVVPRLFTGEVIDISVDPEIDLIEPPHYLDVPGVSSHQNRPGSVPSSPLLRPTMARPRSSSSMNSFHSGSDGKRWYSRFLDKSD